MRLHVKKSTRLEQTGVTRFDLPLYPDCRQNAIAREMQWKGYFALSVD